jgi:UDP-N-acetylglucosamine:LPS N-acetylglucosamine transferase
MMLQPELTAEKLLEELVRLLDNPSLLAAMGARARTLAKPGALERIGEICAGLARSEKTPPR